jgi:hypothetical protein
MTRIGVPLVGWALVAACVAGNLPPGADGGELSGGDSGADAGTGLGGGDGGGAQPDSGSGDAGQGDAGADGGGTVLGDSGVTVLPLGTLTVTDSGVPCLGGAGAGATCMNVRVSCPGLPDLSGMIAVAEPSGTAQGTIVTHTGGSGVGFFAAGPAGKGTEQALTKAGYRFVQLSWDTDWASTGDIKQAACRPATVFQWVFANIQGASRSTGFCGIGSSGGAAALSYSLAAYGLKGSFDYVMLLAGPTPSRIDYGCDPSSYTGGARNLCPLLTNAPWMYSPGVQTIADGWTGTHTCGGAAGASDIAAWQADQLLSAGDDFDYPQTGLSFWYCVSTPNESTGQATFFIDQVHPRNVPDVNCYAGPVDAGGCENEYVLQDSAAFAAAMSEMEASCVPNHP